MEKDRIAIRFTPAYAGHMPGSPLMIMMMFGSPPHTRGTFFQHGIDRFVVVGSPPHTRGTFNILNALNSDPSRFTPAYAGHMLTFLPPVFCSIGSPPHTRGTCCSAEYYRQHRRFTPAYAGHVNNLQSWLTILPVHPRIRGAHT